MVSVCAYESVKVCVITPCPIQGYGCQLIHTPTVPVTTQNYYLPVHYAQSGSACEKFCTTVDLSFVYVVG